MIKKNIIVSVILLLSFSLSFCSKDEEPAPSGDPSNLVVEILSVDEENFNVVLQATAINAVQYQLLIEESSNASYTNSTGLFEHTFEEAGQYNMEVRAYGNSGRYIKVEETVTIDDGSIPGNIPLDSGYFSAESYEGYTLFWQDEFNGNSVNTDNWNYDIGNGVWGWGNNELEYYRINNATVTDGVLIIEAREEAYNNYDYTSSKLHSKGKVSFQYGRVDIRALLPVGQGLWPALWMLGNNINSVGWPKCGEIDIMEMVGGDNRENTIHGTLHWYNGDHAYQGGSKTVSPGTYATAFHVFSMIWDESSIKFYVDDQFYYQFPITEADKTEFHQKFYFILNVAVGGNWPGSPDATTIFPQQMKVDYIRVFQPD